MSHFILSTTIAGATLAAAAGPAAADRLVVPGPALSRDTAARIVYRLDRPATGRGILRIEWTDSEHTIIERRTLTVTLDHDSEIAFTLDPRRGLAMDNRLTAHFSAAGRHGEAAAAFVVSPDAPDWADYQLIMWQPQNAAAYAALESLGVNTAMLHADRAAPRHLIAEEFEPLLQANLRPYIENIATDFYAPYHRWFPDRPVNWRFVEVQKRYHDEPDSRAAFIRDPSLSDPAWLGRVATRLRETVQTYRAYRPLFYNLADEAGIADLNAFWDFDLSPQSLGAMRAWLKERYGALAALNQEWGSRFLNWGAVEPMTTAAAMKQDGGNFAAWADFKDWMDVAFARAVAAGRNAVHAADPAALAGIEGAQKPRWGGYNYTQLSGAVDVMEADSEPEILTLVHALAPRVHLLTTSSLAGVADEHRVWRAWLQGSGGLVIWDPDHDVVAADGALGPHGREAASTLRALRDGLGALVINAPTTPSPVAILYSPASLRVQWMLDWRDKGDAWARRSAEDEWRNDGAARGAMRAYQRSLEQLGFEPRYLSPTMLERGAIGSDGVRVLVLPHALALSAAEARSIRAFVAQGGTVIADSEPGLYDEHGKRLAVPRLGPLFRAGALREKGGRAEYVALTAPHEDDGADPSVRVATDDLSRMQAALERAGVTADVRLSDANGTVPLDVAQHVFQDGKVAIIALQHDFAPGDTAAKRVTLTLAAPAYLYDLRRHEFLGRKQRAEFDLDPAAPALVAVSPTALPGLALSLPRRARSGERVRLRLGLAGASPAAFHILHVEISDPSGRKIAAYSGNVMMRGATIVRDFSLPESAAGGEWRVSVTDALSGQAVTATLAVQR
jgi:hypothetical protein